MTTPAKNSSNLQRLWKQIGRVRKIELFLVLTLMIFCSFAEIISISSIIPFLSVLTNPEGFFSLSYMQPIIITFGFKEPSELMLPITFLFCISVIISGLMRFVLLWTQTRLCHAIGADISLRIYKLTVYQPYEVHINRNSSEVIAGITLKSNGVIFQTLIPLLTLISSSLMLLSILAALIFLDPTISLVTFCGFGFIYLSIVLLSKSRLSSYGQTITNKQNKLIKVLQEGLSSIRDIILDNSQEVFTRSFSSVDLPLRRAQANVQIVGGSPKFFIESFGVVLIALIAFSLSNSDEGILTYIPMLGALALGAQKMLPIIQHSFDSWSKLIGGKATLTDALKLLEQKMPKIGYEVQKKEMFFTNKISVKEINFSYKDSNKDIIKNVSFEISKGDRVGLVGETGCGKSTMIDIIMGLLQPQSGSISIDDIDLNPINMQSWQEKISHVPQSIYLVDASITENIAFGIPKNKINFDKVIYASKIAQIYSIIENMDHKFDSKVGEQAIQLSGGQRQRIAIARALYKDSEIIILDEASSALDSETEKRLMESINSMNKKITIIMVAHRLSTLKNCNKIIEFKKGKINRIGSFEEIIGTNH